MRRLIILLFFFSVTKIATVLGQTNGWIAAVNSGARQSPEARIVVLDVASGRLLASNNLKDAARTLAAPGSTLKPILLYGLLSSGRWDASRRIACSRQLRIAGRQLNCSHPASSPMDAREALAWSCNSYFAMVGASLTSEELQNLVRQSKILGPTGLVANEVVAEFRSPHTLDENRLTVLGVDHIRVTPLEMAVAYRWLAQQMAAHSESVAAQTVRVGLTDSSSFGMAGQASLGGVSVAGKTGTAGKGAGLQTHGWFVGLAPADAPKVVIAVYLPAGHGSDAAGVAGQVLAHSPLKQAR